MKVTVNPAICGLETQKTSIDCNLLKRKAPGKGVRVTASDMSAMPPNPNIQMDSIVDSLSRLTVDVKRILKKMDVLVPNEKFQFDFPIKNNEELIKMEEIMLDEKERRKW